MNSENIINKTKTATKWSFITEIFAKLATPISSIILARILAPDIFGIATAATLVVSFCETISESGFAKYLIQKDFESQEQYKESFSVSFISNLILSLVLIIVIFLCRYPFSKLVGNSGYEWVLVISSLQIPFYSLSSIYTANLRRGFEFKKLFYLRIIFVICPFVITIPLALLGFSYWSLVIGTLASSVIQFIFLVIFSKLHIKLTFSFTLFKKMFFGSFTMLLESLIIWVCSWVTIFVTSFYFDQTSVGLIKVSSSTITSIFGIISGSITSVLFSSLCRLKDDDTAYKSVFYKMTKLSAMFTVPMAIGCFIYADSIVDLLLGSQWSGAGFIVMCFAITRPLMNSLSFHLSEVFRSKGHFLRSLLYQVLMLVITTIILIVGANVSFKFFVISITISCLLTGILPFFFLKFMYHFSVLKSINAFIPSLLCSAPFVLCFLVMNKGYNNYQLIIQMIYCATIYFANLIIFNRDNAKELLLFFKR